MEEGILAVPREARPYQGERAGLVTRLFAGTIDAVSVVAALVVAYGGLHALLFMFDPRSFRFARPSVVLNLSAMLILLVAYLAVAWSTTGRTYGDHVMGLRVVGRHGHRVRPSTALLRAVLCVGFPLGLIWCAGSASRRSLQDTLLRTSVIYDWRRRQPTAADPAIATKPRMDA
jgi:uncharacterized RDD family membrane protein YckC